METSVRTPVRSEPVLCAPQAWQQVLPASFDFYGLGKVLRTGMISGIEALCQEPELGAHAFALQGDLKGVLILFFPARLDSSLYAEMGNIIASRVCSGLSSQLGLDVLVSPPRELGKEESLKRVLEHPEPLFWSYRHLQDESSPSVSLSVVLLSAPSEGAHHA